MTLSRQTFFLFLITTLVFIAAVVGIYSLLTYPYPGHNDFLSRWEGARSYWQDGLNPYGDEASLNIQRAIYGRPVMAGEDPGFFAYPFYTAVLLLPLVQTSYAWAAAIWMVLLGFCLLGALFLLLNLFQWRPAPLLFGLLLLWALFWYFSARGLILGQPGLLVYFLEVLAIWALAKQHDRTAGIALAISTLKPQMGYLIVPFLLLWALRAKRWQFVGAFSIAFVFLMGISFVLLPTWMSDWLNQLALYPSYTALGSPVWILAYSLTPGINPATGALLGDTTLGNLFELVMTGALYVYLLWIWYGVLLQNKQERLLWTIVMTLVITHLVAPRTATPHYVIFMIPILFYLRELTRPRIRRGTLYALLIILGLLMGQWAHFTLTVTGKFEHPSVYLPTPFIIFFLMIFTRRWWWRDEHRRL
jgi:hypothetical protein